MKNIILGVAIATVLGYSSELPLTQENHTLDQDAFLLKAHTVSKTLQVSLSEINETLANTEARIKARKNELNDLYDLKNKLRKQIALANQLNKESK